MDFVIKISEDYTDETVEAQFINPPNIKWIEELLDTNDLEFELDVNDAQIASIIEYKKVSLYRLDSNIDTLLWTGYISNPSNDFNRVFVICSDEKRYMQKKVIYEDKSWSGASVDTILTTLVDEANTRSGGLHGNLTYETDIAATTITKDFDKGTTYYEILDQMAETLDAEWKVVQNKIIFKSTIGEDKTSGPNFVELVSNRTSPNENSITGYKRQRNGNLISTAVIGKNSGSYSEQDDNTEVFGFVESSVSFSDGDLTQQTLEYLNKQKQSQSEIEIIIDPQRIAFEDVNIGDRVKVRIEHDNPLIDVNTDVIVLEKLMEVKSQDLITSIKVGVIKKLVLTPQNYLAKLDKRIKTLELK